VQTWNKVLIVYAIACVCNAEGLHDIITCECHGKVARLRAYQHKHALKCSTGNGMRMCFESIILKSRLGENIPGGRTMIYDWILKDRCDTTISMVMQSGKRCAPTPPLKLKVHFKVGQESKSAAWATVSVQMLSYSVCTNVALQCLYKCWATVSVQLMPGMLKLPGVHNKMR